MKHIRVRQSRFEIGITAILVLLASSPALFSGINSIFAWGHALFLGTLLALALEVARRLHRLAGTLLFAVLTAVLCTEIATYRLTSLHLNSFTLSLLFEGDPLSNIGVSVVLPLLAIALIVTSFLLALHRPNHPQRFRLRWLVLACSGFLAFTQLAYGTLYYQAAPGVQETRRKLAFFSAPHRYYIVRALEPVLGPRPANPFSEAVPVPAARPEDVPPLDIPERKNILLVVMDSVRAKDIQTNPALAPNLSAFAATGQLSLDHYTASNCTHFSLYGMFTGKLPNGFGAVRQRGTAVGFIPQLQANGYATTSAEALSLDWYNLSNMLLPGVTRYVAQAESMAEKDRFVTDTTIRLLTAPYDKPYFHLAYYNGAHFPYGDQDPLLGLVGSTLESYQGAVTAMDAEIGRLMAALRPQLERGELLVMITADHGESVFDDGVIGHSSALTDEQMVVPFASVGGSGIPLPASQLGVTGYLLAQLGVPGNTQKEPVVLSNCGVEVPNGFAVIDGARRADFHYEDGLLSPAATPGKGMPPKADQLWAARQLLERVTSPDQPD
jgi:hypothetical protein